MPHFVVIALPPTAVENRWRNPVRTRFPVLLGTVALGTLLTAGVASADEPYSGTDVEPLTQTRTTTVTRVSDSQLPYTGGEIGTMGLVAAAAVAGGGALVVAGRRRRA